MMYLNEMHNYIYVELCFGDFACRLVCKGELFRVFLPL